MASFISAAELPTTNGRLFYCHQCSHQWRKTENSEYVCPQCREGFIEEVNNDTGNAPGENTSDPIFSIIHRLMSDSTSRAARSRSRSRSPRMSFYIGSSSAEQDEPAGSSSSRRSDRGISHRSFHFDLDDLMSTFLSTRTPPVSQRTLLELQSLTIMQEQTDTPCSICFDDFKLAETSVRKLPCNHLYHERCIFPWLRINGTCPVCRARLPSADAGNDELVGDSTVTNFDNILRFMRVRRNTRIRESEASTSSTSVQTDSSVPRMPHQPLTVRLGRRTHLAQDRARATDPHNTNMDRLTPSNSRLDSLRARVHNMASRHDSIRARYESIRSRMESLRPRESPVIRQGRIRRIHNQAFIASPRTRPTRRPPSPPRAVPPPISPSSYFDTPIIIVPSSDSESEGGRNPPVINERVSSSDTTVVSTPNSSSSSSSSSMSFSIQDSDSDGEIIFPPPPLQLSPFNSEIIRRLQGTLSDLESEVINPPSVVQVSPYQSDEE